MRVAAYQAPYLPYPSTQGVERVRQQLAACEAAGVELLCCPEALIGELANESDGDSPADVALDVDNGELADVLAPIARATMTIVVGFTERAASGDLFNAAAIVMDGAVAGAYRKAYPGIAAKPTAYTAGGELPIFWHGSTPFGVLICADARYIEPARVLAARGARLLLVPVHGGHRPPKEEAWRARGINVLVARAVENAVTVVAADIAGWQGERVSHGTTVIIDPQGTTVARAEPLVEDLLIADVDTEPPLVPGHALDGRHNPAVTDAFLELWPAHSPRSTPG